VLPEPLAGLKGHVSCMVERGGKRKGGKVKEGKVGNGRGREGR